VARSCVLCASVVMLLCCTVFCEQHVLCFCPGAAVVLFHVAFTEHFCSWSNYAVLIYSLCCAGRGFDDSDNEEESGRRSQSSSR
jgi:hypothetical protein